MNLERFLYVDPDNEDPGQIEFINYLSDSDEDIVPIEDNEEENDIEPPPLHNI